MKIFCLLSLVLGFALSASSQTGDNASTTAHLELSLEVKTTPVVEPRANNEAVKYHVTFDLAVKNKGPKEYTPSSPIQELWNFVILQPFSGEKLKWHWTNNDSDIRHLGVGEVGHSWADWDNVNDAESGTYMVIATFDQRSDLQTKTFSLPPPPLMNANILFTGRLMGYYRIPDKQKFTIEKDARCVLDEKVASLDAQTFFHEFPYNSSDHQIRVGVGDNFAPNYYGRAFAEPDGGDEQETRKYGASKGIYYWDTQKSKWKPPAMDSPSKPRKHQQLPEILGNIDDVRTGRGTIPTDNVACFLSYAHYDAIVPGMMDFHFGVERVRELARLLAGITKDTKDTKDTKESSTNYQPVQMLAANMIINTSWSKDHAPLPDSAKHQLPFVTKYAKHAKECSAAAAKRACFPEADSSLEVTNIEDGGFVFPWMQFVHIQAKGINTNALKVYLCEAIGKDPDDFLKNNVCKWGIERLLRPVRLGKDKKELVYQFVDSNAYDKNEKNSSGPESLLKPGHHYAICIEDPQIDPPYCVRFSVYTPFFQYPDWPAKLYPDWTNEGRDDQKEPHYTNPALYVVKNDTTEDAKIGITPVVIFGIVDPRLLENIGADNYSWQTVTNDKKNWPFDIRNDEFKTQVMITPPIPTLKELQQYFEQDYCFHHKGRRFQGIRVLLAQMRPEQARELAEHLPKSVRFDVIISAADNALATPNQKVQMEPAFVAETEKIDDNDDGKLENTACLTPKPAESTGELLTPTSFIAVPPRHDAAETRWLQARNLHIISDGRTWKYDLAGERIKVKKTDAKFKEEKTFWDLIYRQVCTPDSASPCNDTGEGDEGSEMAAIQQFALSAIRDKVRANIALLQAKDFYPHGLKDYLVEHCKQSCEQKLDIQQILERIVWKGDYIKTLSVTGSVLKTVLKKSEEFAETEKAGYIPIDERGNQLVILGIRSDPNQNGEYLINGKPLDPNALYTVATSDYIALGDTGYSDLAKPPVGDPDPPASPGREVYTVSAVTCNAIQVLEKDTPFNKACDLDIPGKDFSDRAERKLDDPRPVNTNFHKFLAWTFLRPHLGQPTAHLPAAGKAEAVRTAMQKKVEADTNWNWSFDQLSIGFSGLSHTGTEQQVSQKLSGVLSPVVAAPHYHSWDWDANSKLTFYQPKSDWFILDILQYSSRFTSQVTGPRSETQSNNQFVLEGGNYFHLSPWRSKEVPQLSLALYGHFETVVGSPITTVQIASSILPLVFDQGRTFLLLGRSGLRWENRKSYIEAGLEGGETLNAIRQFSVLVAPGGLTIPCNLQASVSLTTCINDFNQINPVTPVTNSSIVSVQRRPQDRYGAYWTMQFRVPINDTISYNFQDRSDYFFLVGGDNSADARFRHQLIHTLKFTVLPNLSFEPTYTLFLYENKLDYNFLLQQQYSIVMNYSFNFSNWHERKRQFRYKKP